ncbi:MAG: radical SAM protein [Patescibacteria group bacterium]|nr:radical SAM protein [Patescibacteria group bacterium]
MVYVNVATDKNRILNHLKLIRKKREALDLLSANNNLLCQAGHIELQLTDKCCLNCPNCHFRGLGDKEIPFEFLDNIARFIKPKAITIAGGGEPTLYPNFNRAVLKLAKIPEVKIGLITNGVIIPDGLWRRCVDWVRVSVYSVEDGKYSGMNAELYWKVLNNIEFYLKRCMEIPHIGIHFLFYRKNVPNIIPFIKDVYFRYKDDSRSLGRLHVQFKPAFLMSRPTQLTRELHEENISFLPNKEQLVVFWDNLEDEFRRHKGLEGFLRKKSNIGLFPQLINGGLDRLINITNSNSVFVKNLDECFVCLAYQLIAPDGFMYPCLTLAEYRLHELSVCNVADLPNCSGDAIDDFRKMKSEWCNSLFCRNWEHNKIIRKYLDGLFNFSTSNNNFF